MALKKIIVRNDSSFYELNRNVLIVHKANKGITLAKRKKLIFGGSGLKGNGGLMMILAHLVNE